MTTETRSDVAKQLIELVGDQLGVEPEKVTPQARFIEDLKADSLDVVELIMIFEERFGISISDAEAEKIHTVGAAVDHVENAVARASAMAKSKPHSDDVAPSMRRASYE